MILFRPAADSRALWRRTGRPLVIGHRGASARLPENTLDAFRGAMEDGADGIELDVRLSADGHAVVIHDARLRRVIGVRGRVDRLSAHELESHGIPRLVEALDAVGDGLVMVEIKASGAGIVHATATAIAESGAADRVVVLSFNRTALARLHDRQPGLPTAVNFGLGLAVARTSGTRLVRIASRIGATAVSLHASLATPGRLSALARAGLGIFVWTVDEPAWALDLFESGVDAILTNVPARLVAARGGMFP